MPEKTLVLNSSIFLVKHIVAKTIEQLQQHLKKTYGTIDSGFPEPSPACVPPLPPPPTPKQKQEQEEEQEPITRSELLMQRRFHRPVYF